MQVQQSSPENHPTIQAVSGTEDVHTTLSPLPLRTASLNKSYGTNHITPSRQQSQDPDTTISTASSHSSVTPASNKTSRLLQSTTFSGTLAPDKEENLQRDIDDAQKQLKALERKHQQLEQALTNIKITRRTVVEMPPVQPRKKRALRQTVLYKRCLHMILAYQRSPQDPFFNDVCRQDTSQRHFIEHFRTALKEETNFLEKLEHCENEGDLMKLVRDEGDNNLQLNYMRRMQFKRFKAQTNEPGPAVIDNDVTELEKQLDEATEELERKQTQNKELIQKILSLKSEHKQLHMANTQLEQQKKKLMKDCNQKFKAFVDAYKQTVTQAVTNAGEAAHAMLFDLTGNSDTEEEQLEQPVPPPVPAIKRPSPNNTITQGNKKRSKN